MILHYNIFPSNSCTCGSIVRFYLSECTPYDLVSITEYARNKLDSSLGVVDLFDWQYDQKQGTFRIIMNRGVDTETTMQVMNDLKGKIQLIAI